MHSWWQVIWLSIRVNFDRTVVVKRHEHQGRLDQFRMRSWHREILNVIFVCHLDKLIITASITSRFKIPGSTEAWPDPSDRTRAAVSRWLRPFLAAVTRSYRDWISRRHIGSNAGCSRPRKTTLFARISTFPFVFVFQCNFILRYLHNCNILCEYNEYITSTVGPSASVPGHQ